MERKTGTWRGGRENPRGMRRGKGSRCGDEDEGEGDGERSREMKKEGGRGWTVKSRE